MKLDRKAFLSLVTALSAAACAAPADDAGEQSGASTGTDIAAACVDSNVDRGVQPTAEGCYAVGESWGQCTAWVAHFKAGIARSALEKTGGGMEAYEAGYEALASTCIGSTAEETSLRTFCNGIADAQLASPDRTGNIRGAGFSFQGSSDKATLSRACQDMVRGLKVESRALVKRCITKSPSYPVYSCIEGLGFDDTKAKCEDTNAVASNAFFDRCNEAVADECASMTGVVKPNPELSIKSCIQETEIILAEGGAGASPAAMQKAVDTCTVGTISRACEASGARAACDAPLAALASADPQLTAKGHLNAGGAFTKRCIKTMSALTPKGQQYVGQCIGWDVDAVKQGTKKMEDISLDKCVLSILRAKG